MSASPTPPSRDRYNAAERLLEPNLAVRSDKLAYIDDAGSYTYADLADRVNRCANALTGLGIAREQRVLLALYDTIDFPTAFLGAIKAGIIPVAVNTLLTTNDYEYMLRDSRAVALIVSEGVLPVFAAAGKSSRSAARHRQRRRGQSGRLRSPI